MKQNVKTCTSRLGSRREQEWPTRALAQDDDLAARSRRPCAAAPPGGRRRRPRLSVVVKRVFADARTRLPRHLPRTPPPLLLVVEEEEEERSLCEGSPLGPADGLGARELRGGGGMTRAAERFSKRFWKTAPAELRTSAETGDGSAWPLDASCRAVVLPEVPGTRTTQWERSRTGDLDERGDPEVEPVGAAEAGGPGQ